MTGPEQVSPVGRPRPTVLVADDHPPTRAGVESALEQAGFEVCGSVATAGAAIAAAAALHPDLCLLDVHMPGDGVHAAARIVVELPGTVVVMLTVASDDEHLFAALRAGAAGYLLKDISADRLGNALHAVLRGEAAVPRALVTRLVEELQERGSRRVSLRNGRSVTLTGREWEVLHGLQEGLSTGAIAERLGVAPVTIRTHIAAVLRKLRVPDRAEAVRQLGP